MTKKPAVGDHRQDHDETPKPTNFHVDRVFAPAKPRPRPRETASEVASALLASKRPVATQEAEETEQSLRRQLARLQRQLSEAQLELARKDEELAAESEARHAVSTEYLALGDDHRALTTRVEELVAYQTRTAGVEQRLLETVAGAEAIAHDRDHNHDLLVIAQARITELTAALEEEHARWKADRGELETHHVEEVEQLESQKRLALDQAEEAIAATTLRLRAAHEDQMTQLRESHERSLATLRGEVEPKMLEARNISEERERLTNEIAELRTTASRDAAERDEAHKRELAQLAELHASQLAAQTRSNTTDLTHAEEERDAKAAALEQAVQREQAFEETATALREAQKKLQVEVAEAKEICSQLQADKASTEERLVATAASTEQLIAANRALVERIEASEAEARRNLFDRQRFVAYLEEGLALIGALPAYDYEPEITREDEPDVT